MRRGTSVFVGLLFLAACGEVRDPSSLDHVPEEDSALPTSSDLYDGTTQGNPYFLWLSPIAESSPEITREHDDGRKPTVTVCVLENADAAYPATNQCDSARENDRFSFTGNQISLSPGEKYGVVWKTNDYPVTAGEALRITVSVDLPATSGLMGDMETVELGFADVKAYDNVTYGSFQHTDPDGFIAISDNGNLNINFRIEEGLLTQRYCTRPDGTFEDCDVEIFDPSEAGCLEVYEFPDQANRILGSEACVPANGAPKVGTEEVTGPYAVILTLEETGVPQPSLTIPETAQLPYFPDVTTFPSGISFDRNSDGIQVTICQVEGLFAGQEDLLFEVRPFLVFTQVLSDGTTQTSTILPEDYFIDPLACDNDETLEGTVAGAQGPGGLWGYLAAGVSRAYDFLKPTPLVARRLHGGLNTTVYDTRGGDPGDGEEENVIAFSDAVVEDYVVEAGAVLPPSPEATIGTVPNVGLQLDPTSFTIEPLDGLGEQPAYNVFDVVVEWWVDGVNQVGSATDPMLADGPDAAGLFHGAYTPTEWGLDLIYITLNGELINGSPFEHQVAPRQGDINVSIEMLAQAAGVVPAPNDSLPVKLYEVEDDGSLTFLEEKITDESGTLIFEDKFFGHYVVYLPKRDFDVEFEDFRYDLSHPNAGIEASSVTFTGTTYGLPEGVEVFRIKDAELTGTGNAYQYVLDNRSWTSAQNQIRDVALLDVQIDQDAPAHLATIKGAGENGFVASLVAAQCPNEDNEKRCKYQGWIGLTDDALDGTFVWVNEEGFLNPATPSDPYPSTAFFGWKPDAKDPTTFVEPSGKNNEDHVEINLFGQWTDENGASSTNEGYVTEYDAFQPPADPDSGV